MTRDILKQAKESITIPQAWKMLGLKGEPKSSCCSPWRDEKTPSFSIYENDTKWKDHGEQIGGDVVGFVRRSLGCDFQGVMDWLASRIANAPTVPTMTTKKPKRIQFPTTPTEGEERHWQALANSRQLDPLTVRFLASFGMVKFLHHNGMNCYVVTDATGRNAEIRRINKQAFPTGKKAYPLAGVDKSWLIGADILRDTPQADVLLVEGATDFLTAWDLNVRYRKQAGSPRAKWLPVALLGAGCKALSPDCAKLLAGRHVRIVPDGDKAGAEMLDHWSRQLAALGCTIDTAQMPEGKDLTDLKPLLENEPQTLFQK